MSTDTDKLKEAAGGEKLGDRIMALADVLPPVPGESDPDYLQQLATEADSRDATILALIAELENEQELREKGTIGPGHGVGWTGVAEEWAALPRRIREWVAELETRADPPGDLRQRRIAEDRAVGSEREVAALIERVEEAEEQARAASIGRAANVELAGELQGEIRGLKDDLAAANKLIEAQYEALEELLAAYEDQLTIGAWDLATTGHAQVALTDYDTYKKGRAHEH